jgi:uncharacterized protein (DUF305 family)
MMIVHCQAETAMSKAELKGGADPKVRTPDQTISFTDVNGGLIEV